MAAGHNRSITQLLLALISTITVTARRAAQQHSPAAAFQKCRDKDECNYDVSAYGHNLTLFVMFLCTLLSLPSLYTNIHTYVGRDNCIHI